jgi:hypothetical protein
MFESDVFGNKVSDGGYEDQGGIFTPPKMTSSSNLSGFPVIQPKPGSFWVKNGGTTIVGYSARGANRTPRRASPYTRTFRLPRGRGNGYGFGQMSRYGLGCMGMGDITLPIVGIGSLQEVLRARKNALITGPRFGEDQAEWNRRAERLGDAIASARYHISNGKPADMDQSAWDSFMNTVNAAQHTLDSQTALASQQRPTTPPRRTATGARTGATAPPAQTEEIVPTTEITEPGFFDKLSETAQKPWFVPVAAGSAIALFIGVPLLAKEAKKRGPGLSRRAGRGIKRGVTRLRSSSSPNRPIMR